jgi:hypothetical protein
MREIASYPGLVERFVILRGWLVWVVSQVCDLEERGKCSGMVMLSVDTAFTEEPVEIPLKDQYKYVLSTSSKRTEHQQQNPNTSTTQFKDLHNRVQDINTTQKHHRCNPKILFIA